MKCKAKWEDLVARRPDGYRMLFRPAVTLATELEVAHKALRLPRLLAHYRRFDLILVDELVYLPFAYQRQSCSTSFSNLVTHNASLSCSEETSS